MIHDVGPGAHGTATAALVATAVRRNRRARGTTVRSAAECTAVLLAIYCISSVLYRMDERNNECPDHNGKMSPKMSHMKLSSKRANSAVHL